MFQISRTWGQDQDLDRHQNGKFDPDPDPDRHQNYADPQH